MSGGVPTSHQGLARRGTRDFEIESLSHQSLGRRNTRNLESASCQTVSGDVSHQTVASDTPLTYRRLTGPVIRKAKRFWGFLLPPYGRRWRRFASQATSKVGSVAIVAIILNLILAALLAYFILHLRSKIPKNDIDRIIASWGKPDTSTKELADWPTDFSRDIVPIPCHSQNDYWRRVPLFDALAAGCTGIEADVWLEKDDLLVGHSKKSLTSSRTLRKLYIDPLVGILAKQNPDSGSDENSIRDGVFETNTSVPLTLLIDIKSDAATALPLIVEQLEPLRRLGFLTHSNGSDVITRQISVVATGNTDLDLITSKDSNPHGDIFFDAPLDQLWGDEQVPSNASNYTAQNSYYASVSFSKAVGSPWLGILKPSQVDIIRGQVREASKRGLKARYFDTPTWPLKLKYHVWDVLVREGVGMLSVDDLEGATKRNWGGVKNENIIHW